MPCIVIKAKKTVPTIDVKLLSEELSELTGIDINRISVMVDYYDDKDFFKVDDNLIIFVYISEVNEKNQIDLLCRTIASLAENYFHTKENSSAVICKLIQEGYLFINGIRK